MGAGGENAALIRTLEILTAVMIVGLIVAYAIIDV